MSVALSPSKKRKRDTAGSAEGKVTFSVAPASNDLGPTLAVFPALEPPAETPFQSYRSKSRNIPDGAPARQFIRGSTNAIDFSSKPPDDPTQELACRYLVGIYDKSTKRVRLYNAPTQIIERSVKAMKKLKPVTNDRTAENLKNYQLRNELGEAFGSKKAIKAIRAAERNQVDVSALKGVTTHIQHDIEMGTSALPDEAAREETKALSRPIPPINDQATKPNEVYNVYDVVSEPELRSISIEPYISASGSKERMLLLGVRRSDWVYGHLHSLFARETLDKTSLKLLIVIAAMMRFRTAARVLNKHGRSGVEDRLKNVPDALIDGMFERFTEEPRGVDERKFTNQAETRLLTYMFVLCLRIDGWATMAGVIASDLAMDPASVVNLFKTLGCSRDDLSAEERKRRGWDADEARDKKCMRLKIPLVFPKDPGKRKAGGR